MEIKEYQKLAMRTNDEKCTERLYEAEERFVCLDYGGILNAALGLSGEVGELNDMIKKGIFHGHGIEIAELRKEIGDICWYLAMMCESFGYELDRVMKENIEKLEKRYPNGFNEADSKKRVDVQERKQEEKEYCYSFNGENYYGKFDTREESLKEAISEAYSNYKTVWTGIAVDCDIRVPDMADEVIENIAMNLEEQCGEAAEFFEVSKDDEDELRKRLDGTIEKWIEECNITADCYTVTEVIEHELGEE